MEAKNLDPRRVAHIGAMMSNLELLRLENARVKMRPQPTRSSLVRAIILDWIETQEGKRK